MTIKTWEVHFNEMRGMWKGEGTQAFNRNTYKIYFPGVRRSLRGNMVRTFGVAPARNNLQATYRQYYFAGGTPNDAKNQDPQNLAASRPTTPNPIERPKTPNAADVKSLARHLSSAASNPRPTTPNSAKTPENDATCCNTFGCCGCCILNPIYCVDGLVGGTCMTIGEETSYCINEGQCCFVPKRDANDCEGEACKIIFAGPCFCVGTACFCLNKTMSVIHRAELPACKIKPTEKHISDFQKQKNQVIEVKGVPGRPGSAKPISTRPRPRSGLARQSSAVALVAAKYVAPQPEPRPNTAGPKVNTQGLDEKDSAASPPNVTSPSSGSPIGGVIKTTTGEVMTLLSSPPAQPLAPVIVVIGPPTVTTDAKIARKSAWNAPVVSTAKAQHRHILSSDVGTFALAERRGSTLTFTFDPSAQPKPKAPAANRG